MKAIALRSLLAAITLALGLSCSRQPTGDEGANDASGARLIFTVEEASFGVRTFGPAFTDRADRWVYDPHTKQTRIHMAGTQGGWRVGLDFVVPLSGPGEYTSDTSYRGMDRSFSVALADHRTGQHVALIGVEATLILDPNDSAPQWMSGTFSGRFAVGARSTGRDVLDMAADERTYATIREGRFRVQWKDTLHGAGRTWPIDPQS